MMHDVADVAELAFLQSRLCLESAQISSSNDVVKALYNFVHSVLAMCVDVESGFVQLSVGPLGFGRFLRVVEQAEAWLDEKHLDGPLDDMISNEIDLAAAQVKNRAMSFRFEHGREKFDPPEFGSFIMTLEDFRFDLPVSQILLSMDTC